MKKETFQIVAIVIAAILFCFADSSNTPTSNIVANIFQNFKDGDTLLPDYSHVDTLIVTNAERVNFLFMKSQPATDGEISEVLGKGTRSK